MPRLPIVLCSALTVLPFSTADAAISVYGNTSARACYEAARDQLHGRSAMHLCDDALDDRALRGRDRVATLVNRGILHVLSDDFDAGFADYDRALALDANEPEAYLNKALALLRSDRSEAAVPLFDAAIENGTSEPAVAYYGRGVAHELGGDIAAAYYDILRASELAPEWDVPAQDLRRFVVR